MMLLLCPLLLAVVSIATLPRSIHGEAWGGPDDTVQLLPTDQFTILDMNTFGAGSFGAVIIVSNIPVSILRVPEIQNSNFNNPLDATGVRFLIKSSGCSDPQPVVTSTVIPGLDEYNSTRYTLEVEMENAPAEYSDFLAPSMFDAVWDCPQVGPTGGTVTPPADETGGTDVTLIDETTNITVDEGTTTVASGATDAVATDAGSDPATNAATDAAAATDAPAETNSDATTTAAPTMGPAASTGASPSAGGTTAMASSAKPTSRAPRRIPVTFAIFSTLGGVLVPFLFHGRGGSSSSWLLVSGVAMVFVLVATGATARNTATIAESVDAGSAILWEEEEHRSLQQCTVNLEILYGGCYDSLYVQAPAVRVIEITPTANQTTGDPIQCSAELLFDGVPPLNATGEWPVMDWVNETTGEVLGVMIVSGGCAVPGRPFRDAQGNMIMAETCKNSDHFVWSTLSEESKRKLSKLEGVAPDNENGRLAAEWKQRALGEHASIASFAAFTVALMSNRAPPELIRDSLAAAQDELRHATTAFELASLLNAGTPVEPSHLPPTHLYFDGNLTALALGAAREGCVDETLSALELAVEVDKATEEPLSDVGLHVATKTRTIALEEGRHAALAWRTLLWACTVDESVCDVVKRQVFEPNKLSQYVTARVSNSERLAQAWGSIHEQLVPLLKDHTMISCSNAVNPKSDGASFVENLVDQIVHGVTCPDKVVE